MNVASIIPHDHAFQPFSITIEIEDQFEFNDLITMCGMNADVAKFVKSQDESVDLSQLSCILRQIFHVLQAGREGKVRRESL